MYHDYYALNRMPFQGTPDPDFLYPGPTHREALASLEYGIEAGMGFILLTGEVGLGKTTLIRTFLRRAQRPELFAIYVFHPLLTFDAMLALLCEELGLPPSTRAPDQMMRAIQRDLIDRFERGQRVVLIVDEAHRLPIETLENLRLISNLETDSAKLLQIVIVGQPEIDALLTLPQLRQLDQRIGLRARLKPLSRSDAAAYVRHRLQQAGAAQPERVIAEDGIRALYDHAGGVPRQINALADLALIHGFGAAERPIGRTRVRRAARTTPRRDRVPSRGARRARQSIVIGAGAMLCAAAGLVAVGKLPDGGWLSRAALVGVVHTPAADSTPSAVARSDQARPDGAQAADAPSAGDLAYVVNREDTLARVASEIFGSSASSFLPDILRRNPGLTAQSRLGQGDVVFLPAALLKRTAGPAAAPR